MKGVSLFAAMLLVLALSGCAALDTGPEQADLQARILEATGLEPLGAEDPERLKRALESLLDKGLTRAEAVRIGLAVNPDFQARLAEIGLAKADLIEAGLPENPKLRALFRWPEEGELNYELELGFNLASLWRIPLRSGVASLELERTLAGLGHEAVRLAAEIETAFDRVVFLRAALKEKGHLAGRFQALAREMEKRQRFGYEAVDEVHGVRVEAVEARIGEIRTRTRLDAARAGLIRLLGLDPPENGLKLVPSGPPLVPHLPPLEKLLPRALKNRADIRAARLQARAAAKGVGLARSEVIRDLEVGFNYEREPDGSDLYGPEIGLEVPLFDLNRGGLGRARALAGRAAEILRAGEARVRQELTRDLVKLEAAGAAFRAVDSEIIPWRLKILDHTRRYVAAMQLNRTHLLRSELDLSKARLEREKALLELRFALSELKRDLGGRWPGE